ncbi:ricin-type beta-trefoil lectin domain protein [Solihabitans fulvus]|uniref:Ricin-type beta-trefoil lectin domain protein n=1 Tax=Solihabitans fulvus TaxID=1892852 RepID=A0A5B2XQV2_9PSEU|nr:RICIN domain-containing protein [Solihabitans fulvus]KAA2266047.1 ricin-type beta-trefoil lectin domain protein [Solihabitans fulvus]
MRNRIRRSWLAPLAVVGAVLALACSAPAAGAATQSSPAQSSPAQSSPATPGHGTAASPHRAASVSPTFGPYDSEFYFYVHGNARCIDDPGWSKSQGTAIDLWDCTFPWQANEVWYPEGPYERYGRTVFTFRSRNSGLCLNVPGYSKTWGTQLIQWPCDSYAQNELWLQDNLDGSTAFVMQNLYSGLCLNVNGDSAANGAALIQWQCDKKAENEVIYH